MKFSLALHGGAGLIRRHALGPEREAACRAVLRDALDAGVAVLAGGGGALEACIASVVVLEDSPLFNAGRGAVLAGDGTVQLDAAVMDGADRSAGAVATVRGVRSAVRCAEAVRGDGRHVLLAGADAEAWLRSQGLETVAPGALVVPERAAQLARARAAGRTALDHDLDGTDPTGTVGAVARDAEGHLAAATSTGGMSNKRPGRVGDSPIPGAGTWADDATCAVSATGVGEAILRSAVAARVAHGIALGGEDVETAAQRALEGLAAVGGTGGLVCVDARGRIAMPFDSAGMYRAYRDTDGNTGVFVW